MKLCFLQPQLFPALDYFQVIAASDVCVIDDCSLLKDVEVVSFTVLGYHEKISLSFNMDEYGALKNYDTDLIHILNILTKYYSLSRYFHDVIELVEAVLTVHSGSVLKLILLSLAATLGYLQLQPKLLLYSELDLAISSDRVENIKALQNKFNFTELLDVEGTSLTDHSFKDAKLLKSYKIKYPQMDGNFIPDLSVIDFIFFNHPEKFGDIKDKFVLEFTK